MNEVEADLRALTRDALRRRRLWLAGVAGNALIALLLLGGPYWRGRERARHAREAFASLCACLWDAEVAADPGLTLPEQELPAYADAATHPGWPARCVPEAEALAPERVFWLFPDTRAAEDDLRRARAMILRELREAPNAVEVESAVPMRPRLAVLRVAAAVGVLAREADLSLGLERPAITLERPVVSPVPERVPLRAMSDAEVEMRPYAEGVELFALDARGVSWTRVAGGHVDHRRLRRPALARGYRRDPEGGPWLVWSTPDVRCGASRCERQATGVAPLGDATAVTPTPRWLAAHPLEGARSVAIGVDALWVLARTAEGASLRTFRRSSATEAAPPVGGVGSAPVWSPAAAGSVPGEVASGDGVSGETVLGDVTVGRAMTEPASVSVPLPIESGGVVDAGRVTFVRRGRIVEWTPEGTRDLGAGTAVERQGALRVLRDGERASLRHDDGRAVDLPSVSVAGSLLVVGSSAVLGAVLHTDDRRLHVVRCAPDCDGWRELARGITSFDAVALGDALIVAYVRRARGAQVVRRVDAALGPPLRPAPCFREGELVAEPTGMCGPPLLAASEDRVILGARDAEDVLVVQSNDGRAFVPLRGLR